MDGAVGGGVGMRAAGHSEQLDRVEAGLAAGAELAASRDGRRTLGGEQEARGEHHLPPQANI